MSPFEIGVVVIFVAGFVLYLVVFLRVEPPIESKRAQKLHKKEPERPKLVNETSKPETFAGLSDILEAAKGLAEDSPESVGVPKPQTAPPKHPETIPAGCPYFFGYLKTVPKSARISDECLRCSRLTECFL